MGPSTDAQARFERLYRSHRGTVSDYARRRVGDAAADDVVAEVFAACWRHRDEIDRIDRAWLLAAARNVVLHEYRSAGRQDRVATKLAGSLTGGSADPIDRVAGDLDEATRVAAAMRQLSERDQELLRLVAWEQLTPKEIAVVVGCSPPAARVRVHRASRRLAAVLTATTSTTTTAHRDALGSTP
jgi:RNA polymerase sigma factor (sigma-70 family)